MIRIFLYHSIGTNNYKYSVSRESFDRQVRCLKKRTKLISLAEIIENFDALAASKNTYTAITFDDGYQDNLTEALPVLEKYQVPATIFVTTDFIADSRLTTTWGLACLIWSEVKFLDDHPLVQIESHGVSHDRLDQLDESGIRFELEKSSQILSSRLGRKVSMFAFPKARSTKLAGDLALNYYNLSFSGSGVISKKSLISKSAIPRLSIAKDVSYVKFLLMCSPFYDLILRLWRLKKH